MNNLSDMKMTYHVGGVSGEHRESVALLIGYIDERVSLVREKPSVLVLWMAFFHL